MTNAIVELCDRPTLFALMNTASTPRFFARRMYFQRVTVRSREDANRLGDQRDIHCFIKELRVFSCLSPFRTPVLVNVTTVRLRLGTTSGSTTDTCVANFLSRFPNIRHLDICAGFGTVEALDRTLRGVAAALLSLRLQFVVKAPRGSPPVDRAEFSRLRNVAITSALQVPVLHLLQGYLKPCGENLTHLALPESLGWAEVVDVLKYATELEELTVEAIDDIFTYRVFDFPRLACLR